MSPNLVTKKGFADFLHTFPCLSLRKANTDIRMILKLSGKKSEAFVI